MSVLDFDSGMVQRLHRRRRPGDPDELIDPYGARTPEFNPYATSTTAAAPPGRRDRGQGFDDRLSRTRQVADSIADPMTAIQDVRDYYDPRMARIGPPPKKKHRVLKAIGAAAASMTPVSALFAGDIYDGGYSGKLAEHEAKRQNLADRYGAELETISKTLPTRMQEQGTIYGEAFKPQVNANKTFDPYSGTDSTRMSEGDRIVGPGGGTIAENPKPVTPPRPLGYSSAADIGVFNRDTGELAIPVPPKPVDPPKPLGYSSASGIGIFNRDDGTVSVPAPPRPTPDPRPPSPSSLGNELKASSGALTRMQSRLDSIREETASAMAEKKDGDARYETAKQGAERMKSAVSSTRVQLDAQIALHRSTGQTELADSLEAQKAALPDVAEYDAWAERQKPTDGGGFFDWVGDLFGGDDEPDDVPVAATAPATAEPLMNRQDFIDDFILEEGRPPSAEELEHWRGRAWK